MTIPKQEKRFDYKGFPCVILFMPMGYRCGYVGIPKDTEIDTDSIACHCGIAYEATYLHNQADTDKLWIGFDCGHACDGFDLDKIKELYADDESVMKQTEIMEKTGYFAICNEGNPVRTLEYCEEECKKIVEQLIKLDISMKGKQQ